MGAATMRRNHAAHDRQVRENPRRPHRDVSRQDHNKALAELHQRYGREILALKAKELTATVDITGVDEVTALLRAADEHLEELSEANAKLQAEVDGLKADLEAATEPTSDDESEDAEDADASEDDADDEPAADDESETPTDPPTDSAEDK